MPVLVAKERVLGAEARSVNVWPHGMVCIGIGGDFMLNADMPV